MSQGVGVFDMDSKGFTLIELVVIIVILGVVAAVGGVNLRNSSERYTNITAVERVIQELRSARAEAVVRNQCVDFALVDSTAKVYAIRELAKSAANTYSVTETIQGNIRIGDEYKNSTITFANLFSETVNGSTVTGIVFNNRGRVDNPNGNPTITITTNNVNRTINVSPNTGYIR